MQGEIIGRESESLGLPTRRASSAREHAPQANAITPKREPLLKRPLDVALSGVGLVLSAPLWLALALAIKLEDGGPVFYRQERWGRAQTRFQVFKFRSMVTNAGMRQAVEGDSRITRMGRIMRAAG